MKIYLICMDAMPWGEDFAELQREFGLTRIPTLNQGTFTFPSILARLTGALPGDLVPGGLGSRTLQLERYYDRIARPEVSLFRRFSVAGWTTEIRNSILGAWNFLPTRLPPPGLRKTGTPAEQVAWLTAPYPGMRITSGNENGVSDFYAWPDPVKRAAFYEREREWIRAMQGNREGNTFLYTNQGHWHQYRYYHKELDLAEARREALAWLRMWDFEEEDALFWIFSDHGYQCTIPAPPPDHLTWTLVRDNGRMREIGKAREWPQVMAGCDFYPLALRLIEEVRRREGPEDGGLEAQRIEEAPEAFEGEPPPVVLSSGFDARLPIGTAPSDRIYFLEDARGRISPYESITAAATTVSRWGEDGTPLEVTQLTWLRHRGSYHAFRAPVDAPDRYESIRVSVTDPVLERLRGALVSRVHWLEDEPLHPGLLRKLNARAKFFRRRARDRGEASRTLQAEDAAIRERSRSG